MRDDLKSTRVWSRAGALDEVESFLKREAFWNKHIVHFKAGDILLQEGERQQRIGILLEGEVDLIKGSDSGKPLRVDRIVPGDMIGLLSYLAKEINFVEARASSSGRMLLQEWDTFGEMLQSSKTLEDIFAFLMRENLSGRYRRLVGLHSEMTQLNRELAQEREELKSTVFELEQTRNRLIHQEKLAMLGQIVAGLAHELNNPVAALLRNLDYMDAILKQTWEEEAENPILNDLWHLGRTAPIVNTRQQRENAQYLEKRFSSLPPRLMRRLSAMPANAITERDRLPQSLEEWESWLRAFESGRCLHTLLTSSTRIASLVQSLKSYARPPSKVLETVDLKKGIEDTLLVLSNRFRDIEIDTHLDDLPTIVGNAGELNQIWTNLLVNSCDAMENQGAIVIHTQLEKNRVYLFFEDSGPGIPPDSLETIFAPHYTTKSKGGNFGLGLGLSIARDIARQHGGDITAENRPENGARFTVSLPLAARQT